MRVCVVGCGAVGSLFAAGLATLEDVEVWAFDLNKEHVDAITKNGLQLTGADEVHSKPRATSDPAALPPCDFGIVATKAMHADAAIAATAHAFTDGAVASVMNGVGNEETLARHVERVIRGTTFRPERSWLRESCSGMCAETRRSGRTSRGPSRYPRSSPSPTPARAAEWRQRQSKMPGRGSGAR